MEDLPGSSKRLRKTIVKEGTLTSDDLNCIMNWSSDDDIDSGSSWSGGSQDICDSSEENIEPIIVDSHTQSIQNDNMSGIWHEEKYVARSIPFTGTTGLLVSNPGNKPYDFFKLCANEKLFAFIVDQTNMYAEEIFLNKNITENSRITKWKTLTIDEFKVFLGLLYHMGTIRTNRISDYWKRGYLFDLSCFNSRMSRDRWLLILRCLHFAKNPSQNEHQPQNRLYKINPLLDIFHENMDRIQYPTRVLAVDESMVLWRGCLIFRQFMQGKRHKYGLKLYVLTDAFGFVLKCIVYSGSNDKEVGGKGHVTNVVKKLLEDKLGMGHSTSIYMDNYYNSLELAQFLLNNNTYCTGTLRANRMNNPQEVIETKLKKGEIIQRYTQEGTCVMKWTDWRDVLAISTEYDGTMVKDINKRGNEITKPEAILQYNKFMGGIDHSDQMLSYYTCEHKTMRWYKKLAIHIFQIILVNSHNLFNRYSGSKLNLYDFRLSVIETLIKEGLETTSVPRCISTPKPHSGNHYPKMVERNANGKKKVRRCQECVKTQKRSETDIYCPMCPGEPGLCVYPCFKNYHRLP